MSVKFDFKTLETGYEADWPVTVKIPIDGGLVEEQTFMARFRTPTPAERAELEAMDTMKRLERAMEIGFVGLAKSEDEPLTPELRARLWGEQTVQIALIRAYATFQTGTPAKN